MPKTARTGDRKCQYRKSIARKIPRTFVTRAGGAALLGMPITFLIYPGRAGAIRRKVGMGDGP